jgi:hypothetical protein
MKIKQYLVALLLVIPMVSRWLLPEGGEQRFIIHTLGFPVYLFNFAYLIIFFSGIYTKDQNRIKIIHLVLCQMILALFGWIFADYSDRWTVLFINQVVFWIPILFLLFQLNKKQIDFLKYILVPAFFIICGEIIIYSLGILQYNDLSGQEYGGIMRISTTIGAATGTGIILFALGVFVLQHYIHKPVFQYVFLGIWGTSLLYTVSRSTIICFLLFATVYLWKNVSNLKVSKKIIFISGIVLLFVTLNSLKIFEPIVEREKALEASDNILSGREERYMRVGKSFVINPLFGVGIGNVFPTKDVRYSDFVPLYFAAVHNYWLLILGEQGMVGFLCLLVVCVVIIRKLDYSNYCSFAILLIIFVMMNTETLFVYDEFIALLFLLISSSLKPYSREV